MERYDVIIIGGGPAGVAAGVYAARKKMKTLLVAEMMGGQSSVSATIENWIGEVSVRGFEFAQKLEKHVRAQEDIDIQTGVRVTRITKTDRGFLVETNKKEAFETKTIVYAGGGKHRHLDIPGEERFVGKGVVYCSTCDAPFFRGKTVAVVGGGNSGLEACQDLYPYAEKIYLLSRGTLTGDATLQNEVTCNQKVTVVPNAQPKEILGEASVTGLVYSDDATGKEITLSVGGVFVEIGMIPDVQPLRELVTCNDRGEIVIDHRTGATSCPGIFAAGDATDLFFRQNNIAAGAGAIAALSAYEYSKQL